jgi:hypothetical protein
MRVAGLFVVLALTRIMILAGHHVPLSWWSPVAFFWQDAVVVLVFAAIESWCVPERSRAAWGVYGVLVAYIAINIPVFRVLSTPLTWPMLRAARGPLADSIMGYATWTNLMPCALVLAAAFLAPWVFRRARPWPLLTALVLCAAAGPTAAAQIDTLGLERNAWAALVVTAMPRITDRPVSPLHDGWRAPSLDTAAPGENLSRYSAAAGGRHVVAVSLESTAAQYLGLYGAVPDVMPNLSELARSAIVFDHAYAVYPESIKGLFSILCSRYPAFDRATDAYATVPCQSMAQVLSASGYRTALFHSGRFAYLGMNAIVRHRGFATLEDAGVIGGNYNSSFGVDEPSTVARILSWIDRVPAGQRFFVTYLPIAGHHPYETPEPGPFPEHDEFGRYRNALRYGDAALGALMRGLDVRGLAQKTLWIVFGDHGEAFGQHDGNYGHTFHLYDENVRVPFIVAAPGLVSHQVRSADAVSLVDTAPTVLDFVGLPVPDSYQGRSMLGAERRPARFFADYSLSLLGLRDGRWKFIYELDSGRSKLFDLETDPNERVNLADRHAEQTRAYAEDLRQWGAVQKHLLQAAR